MPKTCRLGAALLAPFLLAGCGLPIGVQIASLFADGVSVLTTDKTLTDHGISAVTEKDCALWRGVEGRDICTEVPDQSIIVADANSGDVISDDTIELEVEQNRGAARAAEEKDVNETLEETPEFPKEDTAVEAPAPTPAAKPEPVHIAAPVRTESLPAPKSWSAVAVVEDVIPAAPPKPKAVTPKPAVKAVTTVAAPAIKTPKAKSKPANAKPTGSTYYIIASYHRSRDAERFSRRHAKLKAAVIPGTAKGRRVFRVAVGPVARDQRSATRSMLRKKGFRDTWRLTYKHQPQTTELAALN